MLCNAQTSTPWHCRKGTKDGDVLGICTGNHERAGNSITVLLSDSSSVFSMLLKSLLKGTQLNEGIKKEVLERFMATGTRGSARLSQNTEILGGEQSSPY